MNVFTFTGSLGKDCRKGRAGDTDVVNFSVAATSGYGDNKATIWVECAYWGKAGTAVAPYLLKGQKVCVSGELSHKDEKEHGMKIAVRVNSLTLVGAKADGSQQSAPVQRQSAPVPADLGPDEEIPF